MNGPGHIACCTIAGSDPTGGAGLQGDLKTFAAHGVQGTAVVTAVTVQGRGGVARVDPMDPGLVAEQVAVVRSEVAPQGIKTGMLWDGPTIRAVARALEGSDAVLVVDPVLVATAGGALMRPDALPALAEALVPLARVLTPNLPEAARLLGVEGIAPDEVEDAARRLLDLGAKAVLLKGGHGEGDEAVDVLATAEGTRRFALPRVRDAYGHGTGCALAASLAANLAFGWPLAEAVERSKAYVHRALTAAAARGPDALLVHDVPA